MAKSKRQSFELAKYLMDCGKFVITTVVIGRIMANDDTSWWTFVSFFVFGIALTWFGYHKLGSIHDMDEKKDKKRRN